jgi:hypothetical protein
MRHYLVIGSMDVLTNFKKMELTSTSFNQISNL